MSRRCERQPQLKLFGPSALDDPSLVSALGSAAHNLYVSVPAASSAGLRRRASSSATSRPPIGHAPAAQAIFGYAAMQAVLFALRQAGSSVQRPRQGRSTSSSRSATTFRSVLGTYSINGNGDTSLAPFVLQPVQRWSPSVRCSARVRRAAHRPHSLLAACAAGGLAGCGASKTVAGDRIAGDNAHDLLELPLHGPRA